MFDVSKVSLGAYLCVSRLSLEGDVTTGIVINVVGDFLCIKEYFEFSFVGYCLISTRDIRGVFEYEYEDKISEIISTEKWHLIDDDMIFLSKACNWMAVFKELLNNGAFAVYELDSEEIHLGKIISYNGKSLNVICINQNFSIDRTPFQINYDDLVSITLKSNYVDVYRRFSN